jgi:hypothetical protein
MTKWRSTRLKNLLFYAIQILMNIICASAGAAVKINAPGMNE